MVATDLRDSGFELWGTRALGDVFRDIGWFRLDRGVTPTNMLRGGYVTSHQGPAVDGALNRINGALHGPRAIGGRLPVSAVRPGQIVCKDGGRTGRTCGPVLRVNPGTGEIYSALLTIPGDSGSPIYIVGRDGKAYIVGVHGGGRTPFDSEADAVMPLPAGLQ